MEFKSTSDERRAAVSARFLRKFAKEHGLSPLAMAIYLAGTGLAAWRFL